MKTTVILEGGLGKHIAFTALIPKLKKKYGELQIYTPYVNVFAFNPDVKMAFDSNTLPLRHPDIIDGDIVFAEPYKSNWQKGKQSLLQSYAELLGIKYNPKTDVPKMFTENEQENVEKVKEQLELDKFIVVQFTGGQTSIGFNPQQQYVGGTAVDRNYPIYLAQAAINIFKEKYPDIAVLNWGMPNEPQYHNAIPLDVDFRIMHALAKESSGFISTDSSLQHIMKSVGKSGVSIHGETAFHQFGYDTNTRMNAFAKDEWDFNIDTQDPRTVMVDPGMVVEAFVEKHLEQ